MSFPLKIGAHEVADPPGLAALVRSDSGALSGRVIEGQRPHQWLMGLVTSGALEHRMAVGLAAALLQNAEAETVCEGARLARALGDRAIGPLVLRALDAHDTALLLRADPADPSASVEDVLLGAGAALGDLADPAVRRPLLERLRNAGLPEIELPVLLGHGDALDLQTWLPAVLAEPLTEAQRASLRERATADDEPAAVIREILGAREG